MRDCLGREVKGRRYAVLEAKWELELVQKAAGAGGRVRREICQRRPEAHVSFANGL